MARVDPIELFVERGGLAGMSHAQMRAELLDAGWSEGEIDAALSGWHPRDAQTQGLPPIPRPQVRFSFLDLLAYLVLLGSLATTAFYLVTLTHGLIDAQFGDLNARRSASRVDGARWALSTLIVSAGVYGAMTRWLDGRLHAAPHKRNAPVRKGALGLMLVSAAATLAGDAVATIHALLGGDLTLQFILKTVVVAIVAVGIVLIARDDLTERQDARIRRLLHAAGGIATVGLVIWSVVALGNPSQARALAQDRDRLDDIAAIADSVLCTGAPNLPVTLPYDGPVSYCRGSLLMSGEWRDPASGARYDYVRVTDARFEICADFDDPRRVGDRRHTGGLWTYDPERGCIVGSVR